MQRILNDPMALLMLLLIVSFFSWFSYHRVPELIGEMRYFRRDLERNGKRYMGEIVDLVLFAIQPRWQMIALTGLVWCPLYGARDLPLGTLMGSFAWIYLLTHWCFNCGIHHGERLPPLKDRCFSCDVTLDSYKPLLERQPCHRCRGRAG